jgi:hypothetical protein
MSEKTLRSIFLFGTLFFLVILGGMTADSLSRVTSARTPQLRDQGVAGKRIWQGKNCVDANPAATPCRTRLSTSTKHGENSSIPGSRRPLLPSGRPRGPRVGAIRTLWISRNLLRGVLYERVSHALGV